MADAEEFGGFQILDGQMYADVLYCWRDGIRKEAVPQLLYFL